jgi:hypothetical protein
MDRDNGVTVTSVKETGTAFATKKVTIGMKVLSVDGVSMEGKTKAELVAVIKALTGEATYTFEKPDNAATAHIAAKTKAAAAAAASVLSNDSSITADGGDAGEVGGVLQPVLERSASAPGLLDFAGKTPMQHVPTVAAAPGDFEYTTTLTASPIRRELSLAETLAAFNNEDAERSVVPHVWKVHNYLSPTFCCHCKKLLVGLYRQGQKCTCCGINAHGRCIAKLQHIDCAPLAKKANNHNSFSFHKSNSAKEEHDDIPEEDAGRLSDSVAEEGGGGGVADDPAYFNVVSTPAVGPTLGFADKPGGFKRRNDARRDGSRGDMMTGGTHTVELKRDNLTTHSDI